jgi:hypothetical protein
MNTTPDYYFPFGQKLTTVQEADKTPKKAFVLGVYASAVHALWNDKDGNQKVAALAVASEPSIFWTGDNADQIIAAIDIPDALGTLSPPKAKGLNGPSGRALDQFFLQPLWLSRKDTWLCDLLPQSRVNAQQRKAIDKHYTAQIIQDYGLPEATVPPFDKSELNSATRREAILQELETSQAETLLLLGDLPISGFLRYYTDKKYSKLSEMVKITGAYGKPHELTLNNKHYNVYAFCHPRQAAKLGSYSVKWGQSHGDWIKERAGYGSNPG